MAIASQLTMIGTLLQLAKKLIVSMLAVSVDPCFLFPLQENRLLLVVELQLAESYPQAQQLAQADLPPLRLDQSMA